MLNRIFARSKDEVLIIKLIDLITNDNDDAEFNFDYQSKTKSFVLDIKTESDEFKIRIEDYMKEIGITDTKSIGIIGG